jgi:hypothetical protein
MRGEKCGLVLSEASRAPSVAQRDEELPALPRHDVQTFRAPLRVLRQFLTRRQVFAVSYSSKG